MSAYKERNENHRFLDQDKITHTILAAPIYEKYSAKRMLFIDLMLNRIAQWPGTYSTLVARSIAYEYTGTPWKHMITSQRQHIIQQIENRSVDLIKLGILQEAWKKRFVPRSTQRYGEESPYKGIGRHVHKHTRLLFMSPDFLLPGYPAEMTEVTDSPEWMTNRPKRRKGVDAYALRSRYKRREIEKARDAILGQKPGFGKVKP